MQSHKYVIHTLYIIYLFFDILIVNANIVLYLSKIIIAKVL